MIRIREKRESLALTVDLTEARNDLKKKSTFQKVILIYMLEKLENSKALKMRAAPDQLSVRTL